MPVYVYPLNGEYIPMQLSISPEARVRLAPVPDNTVPLGYDACFQWGGQEFSVRDYRGRPNHEPGALVIGDGVTCTLSPDEPWNAIDLISFFWYPPGGSPPTIPGILP